MTKIKPSLPKGVRDFAPEVVAKRQFIIKTIRTKFEQFGYMPLETPSFENLTTLTGKYGEEGDKLLFKILNSGDYLSKADKTALDNLDSRKLTPTISKKGLRYDLTVPLARFVSMNSHNLAMPFKRYQVQPVWRADRPQKGRYQEFYQCDADVLGSTSLLNEVELTQIYHDVFKQLGIKVKIRVNNRKLLAAVAELAGVSDRLAEMTIAIDKLDKAGRDGVVEELKRREFSAEAIQKMESLIFNEDSGKTENELSKCEIGAKGVEELTYVRNYISELGLENIEYDITLARGLDYYTGTIYEVACDEVGIGALGGGGRYDDLTGIFGLPNVSGVGISFGLDRIYDAMEELQAFPETLTQTTKVLFINFDEESEKYAFKALQEVRAAGVAAEIYPSSAKLKKQMTYANNKQIPFVVLSGSREIESGTYTLKEMQSGEQNELNINALIEAIKA